MKVLLTGATGYVGQGMLQSLVAAGHQVRCLVRGDKRPSMALINTGLVETVHGDILQPETLVPAMQGCEAIIHLVGIIREQKSRGVTFDRIHVQGTRNVLEAARQAGIKRFLHMSALGAREGATSAYHRSKWQAEELVRGSGLDWTIFRPSVIFAPGDEFVNMLADVLKKAPFFPIFGTGTYALQPVARENVTDGFVRALERPASIGRVYEVGGPAQVPYRDLIQIIGRAIGKRHVRTLSVPVPVVRPVVNAMEGYSFFPITSSMLTMLLEGNTCDPTPFERDFDLVLIPFAEGIGRYL